MPAERLTNVNVVAPELLTERLIRTYYLPIGGRTLARWVSSGQFPRADLAIGGKCRFWKRETVEAWIVAQAGQEVPR